jgi:hypothetical protein
LKGAVVLLVVLHARPVLGVAPRQRRGRAVAQRRRHDASRMTEVYAAMVLLPWAGYRFNRRVLLLERRLVPSYARQP